jgi:Domain of unknown function (DUF5615)
VTAFLIDEMFPPATAAILRDAHRRDAIHVSEAGLQATADAQVAAFARAEGRAIVTENVADYAAERDVILIFVLKRNLPAGGAQAPTLARCLDNWSRANPEPYIGPHWPSVSFSSELPGVVRYDGGVRWCPAVHPQRTRTPDCQVARMAGSPLTEISASAASARFHRNR